MVESCPVCQAEHAVGARFCPTCGTALVVACAHCGALLSISDVFCSQCGQRVAGPAARTTNDASVLAADGEERKFVTIVFADVAGSTALAERLDPEQLREVMQHYFDAMREEIEAEGGVVEKFIGDAVMAAFGVPTAHEDDPSRALRAAHSMCVRLESVNAELAVSHGLALQLRIGVNSGEVLAATSPLPGETMVTGETVNVAARLQTAADPGEVVVSERTALASRGFTFSAKGLLELKGKREPVRAFRLAAMVGGPTRGAPYLVAPMVGRDAELEVLQTVYARTTTEARPHLVTIYGEAGVGKSRLTREFVNWAEAQERPPLILTGRCLPYGTGVTYWPLAEMLKDLAGIKDTDTPAEALARIDELTASFGAMVDRPGEASRTAALLAYTLGVPDSRTPMERMDPLEVRRQLHLAWRAFFTSLAVSVPVVVIVEDIHWAETALLDLLDELADRTQGPVLYLFPARPDLVATRPAWGGGRRNSVSVSLEPLDAAESERLVQTLLTIEDLPPSLHARILERAEGNPFFLEEILRQLIDQGAVRREDDRWRAAPEIEGVVLPDSVQGVLASRIDLLSTEDKQALQAAAVVGRVFWTEPVQLLMGGLADEESEQSLEEVLHRLEDREMVRPRVGSAFAGQPEYIFKHILTRDVAYESIPRRRRSQAHAQVARWLEHTAGERAAEFGELLAHHYGTAALLAAQASAERDPALRLSAIRWLMRASDDARRRYVLTTAARLAQEALELAETDVERCDALTALADTYMTGVRGDLAWQYYVRAAEVADASPDIPDLRTARLIASACELPVRWPGSMTIIVPEPEVRALRDRGIALVGDGDSRERARLLAVCASWPFSYPQESPGPPEAYADQALQGVEIALRLGDVDLASGCYDAAAAAYQSQGDYLSAWRTLNRRWTLRDQITQDLEVVDLYAMMAWHSWELGDYPAAVTYARSIEQRTRHTGLGHAMAWGAVALYRLGRWQECLATFDAVRDQLDTRRDHPPNFMNHMFAAVAIVHQVRGHAADADRLASLIAAIPDHGIRVYGWRIQLAMHRGDLDRARALLANPPTSWEIHASVTWEVRCDAILRFGDWERAIDVAAAGRRYADECGPKVVRAFADRVEGAAEAALGKPDRGVNLLASARDSFAALGCLWEAARTRLLLAAALERLEQHEAAAVEQAAAEEVLRSLGVVRDAVMEPAVEAIRLAPSVAR